MVARDHAQTEALPSIVLLVDSDAEALATCSAAFEASGLWVAGAADPAEGLEAIHELKPDLVITDHFDAAVSLVEAIKARADTRMVPVILLSRRPLVDVPLATRQLADLCLEKPVLNDTLLENSRALIAQFRALRARSDAGREPAPNHVMKLTEVVRSSARPDGRERNCPACGSGLEWIERGRLCGSEYDYYRWCASGCGLYCYDRDADTWVKLA